MIKRKSSESSRKIIALIFSILIASGYAFCQTENYRDASVLDKVTQLQGMDLATRVLENLEIVEELTLYTIQQEEIATYIIIKSSNGIFWISEYIFNFTKLNRSR